MFGFSFLKPIIAGGPDVFPFLGRGETPCVPRNAPFKKIKTEPYGLAQKTLSVHPRMLGRGIRITWGEKNTPSGEGEGREGKGRGVTFLTQNGSIVRN